MEKTMGEFLRNMQTHKLRGIGAFRTVPGEELGYRWYCSCGEIAKQKFWNRFSTTEDHETHRQENTDASI